MLNWIGGPKPDHPLADATRAQELLAALPQFDPPKALEELRDWVESVMRTPGFRFEERVALIKLLDETSQPFHRKLLRDYLSAPRLQKFQEHRQWTAASSFWGELGRAYLGCLGEAPQGTKGPGRGLLALAVCRGQRAVGQLLKWMQFRYGPIDASAWVTLSGLYRFACERGVDREAVDLSPALPQPTTAEGELLKVLMLWIAAPDTLPPPLIELAERLTSHFAAAFVLERGAGGACAHCYDLDAGRAPFRAAGGAAGTSLLFFGPGAAAAQMDGVRNALESGTVPREINLGASYEPPMVLDALDHLALHWATNLPERRHARHKVQVRLDVITTLSRLLDELSGAEVLDFESMESWVIEDISAGGFGAVIPQFKPEWIRVGALIGTRPEGVAQWGIGIIRRLRRDAQNQGQVGVQTLSREVRAVRLRPVNAAWGAGLAVDDEGYLPAAWFADGGDGPGDTTLIMGASLYSPTRSLEMLREGKTWLVIPMALSERGSDYDVARFRAMHREEGAAQ